MVVVHGGEGTSYYKCVKCQMACDPAEPKSEEAKPGVGDQEVFNENNLPLKKIPTLEERVARIEKWIDFWETCETPWRKL